MGFKVYNSISEQFPKCDGYLICVFTTSQILETISKIMQNHEDKDDYFISIESTIDPTDLKLQAPQPDHIEYLMQRGCTLQHMLILQPKSHPANPKYVFFDYSYTKLGRRVVTGDPKYIKLNDTQAPYGIERVDRKPDKLVIVEGVFDMLHFLAAGIPTIALLSKDMSRKHISLIEALRPKRIYVVLDGDASKAAQKVAEYLCFVTNDLQIINLPVEHDPWTYGSQITELIS